MIGIKYTQYQVLNERKTNYYQYISGNLHYLIMSLLTSFCYIHSIVSSLLFHITLSKQKCMFKFYATNLTIKC